MGKDLTKDMQNEVEAAEIRTNKNINMIEGQVQIMKERLWEMQTWDVIKKYVDEALEVQKDDIMKK